MVTSRFANTKAGQRLDSTDGPMFASTASGFADTPVTKLWIYFSLCMPIFVSLAESQYLFDLAIDPQLLKWGQWWRLITNQLIYTNQSEALLSTMLIYNMRVVERFYGTRKYLSFVLLTFIFSCFAVPVLCYLVSCTPFITIGTISPGQTSTICAALYSYHTLVPVVYRFQISPLGSQPKWGLSDKAFVYIIALQLIAFHGLDSPIAAGLGWTFAALVQNDIIPGKSWRLPLYSHLHLEPAVRQGTDRADSVPAPVTSPATDHLTRDSPESPSSNSATTSGLSSQIFETFRP